MKEDRKEEREGGQGRVVLMEEREKGDDRERNPDSVIELGECEG